MSVAAAISVAAEKRDRFMHDGRVLAEQEQTAPEVDVGNATEAVTGYDHETNGYLEQGPAFDTLTDDNVVALRSFNDNPFIFEEVESVQDGLGPVYNAQSCRECHQNVVTGGASQITEQRTGRQGPEEFFESLGGTILHSRATHPELVELVDPDDNVRTFRISTNILGSGCVEAVSNETLLSIRDQQPRGMRGVALETPVLEANNAARIGRFGWKSGSQTVPEPERYCRGSAHKQSGPRP